MHKSWRNSFNKTSLRYEWDFSIEILDGIHQTRLAVFEHISTEKRVENTTRNGVFLMNLEVFKSNTVYSVWYIFSIETKSTKKTEK